MDRDGDCFFWSIMYHLNKNHDSDARVPIRRLKEKFPIAVTSELVQENMTGILRQCLVGEWLDNPSEYAPFITSNEKKFEDMAKEFLTSGHFTSEIGNSMPMAMPNVLSLPIAIFKGMQNMPIILATLRGNVASDVPICLAYEYTGTGHYDYLIRNDTNTNTAPLPNAAQPSLANKDICCRCGQAAKKQRASFESCKDYKSRCFCFRGFASCTVNYSRINSINPCGKRQVGASKGAALGRKRRRQEFSTNLPAGKDIWVNLSHTKLTMWSNFEELVLFLLADLLAEKTGEAEVSVLSAHYTL